MSDEMAIKRERCVTVHLKDNGLYKQKKIEDVKQVNYTDYGVAVYCEPSSGSELHACKQRLFFPYAGFEYFDDTEVIPNGGYSAADNPGHERVAAERLGCWVVDGGCSIHCTAGCANRPTEPKLCETVAPYRE